MTIRNNILTLLITPSDVQTHIREAARQRRIALNITQASLARRSGVTLPSLKRFEQSGDISLTSLLRLAATLDALDGFAALFPRPEPRSLDDLERHEKRRKRASGRQG